MIRTFCQDSLRLKMCPSLMSLHLPSVSKCSLLARLDFQLAWMNWHQEYWHWPIIHTTTMYSIKATWPTPMKAQWDCFSRLHSRLRSLMKWTKLAISCIILHRYLDNSCRYLCNPTHNGYSSIINLALGHLYCDIQRLDHLPRSNWCYRCSWYQLTYTLTTVG